MGSCVICGTPADGEICDSHEQDVLFEFTGTAPHQLTAGRYYSGTVDGFAEFGVFVNIGDKVTGLLHKSELDQRLDSLDWDDDDEVFVQVTGVRDNGNVDLGWSIRQSEREFRGKLVDDPEAGTYRAEEDDDEGNENPPASADGSGADAAASADTGDAESDEQAGSEATDEEPGRVAIATLSDRVGDEVRIEGEVVGARQTGGPTVFEVRDETATVDCAAFVEAGVRAYPEVDTGDIVRLDGEVELRHNELQVETEELTKLDGDEKAAVEGRMADALAAEARPDDVELLADHAGVEAIREEIVDAAETVRRAVMESRPVIVRHNATADGYVAGAAIERAVLPLVREEYAKSDAEYHFFDRRPLEDGYYDMEDATKDVTNMLDNRERHDEKLPLFVLVEAGSTVESRDGLELLDVYDAPTVIVDTSYPAEGVEETTDVVVNPYLGDEDAADVTAGVLGTNVAAHVNDDVREDIRHLPAVSYWQDTPEMYLDLADAAGYDAAHTTALREAVALEAYYQSYEDKRELVKDLLFEHEKRDLAEHISEQFSAKLRDELDTVEPNLSVRGSADVSFTVLDTDAYTHRFDFPPTGLLLDAVHRNGLGADGAPGDTHVTLGVADDELHIRSDEPIDVRDIVAAVREEAPNAGVLAKGTRNGTIEFLAGERDAVVDAVVDAVTDQFA